MRSLDLLVDIPSTPQRPQRSVSNDAHLSSATPMSSSVRNRPSSPGSSIFNRSNSNPVDHASSTNSVNFLKYRHHYHHSDSAGYGSTVKFSDREPLSIIASLAREQIDIERQQVHSALPYSIAGSLETDAWLSTDLSRNRRAVEARERARYAAVKASEKAAKAEVRGKRDSLLSLVCRETCC